MPADGKLHVNLDAGDGQAVVSLRSAAAGGEDQSIRSLPIRGDQLKHAVQWASPVRLPSPETPVQLQFVLSGTWLYCYQFVRTPPRRSNRLA